MHLLLWLCLLCPAFLMCGEPATFIELARSEAGILDYSPNPDGIGSLFRFNRPTGPPVILATEEIDPFFNSPELVASLAYDKAIVSGATGSCPLAAVLSFGKDPRIDRIIPVIAPSHAKVPGHLAFLSWQDRGNVNTHTAVVNIWRSTPQGLVSQVVYPPQNAMNNDPQPWIGGADSIALVSPLVWSPDASHLGFVVRSGDNFVYSFVDVSLANLAAPSIRRYSLSLSGVFSRDPALYIGGVGLKALNIDWNKDAAATLTLEQRPFVLNPKVEIPPGKPGDYLDFVTASRVAAKLDGDALLRFEKSRIDLGTIERKMHRVEVKYTNTRNEEVRLLALARTCPCFTYEEHDQVIPAHASGSIGVWVDMAEITGQLLKPIVVLVATKTEVQNLRVLIKATAK